MTFISIEISEEQSHLLGFHQKKNQNGSKKG